jgi:hypothetical protein
MFLQEEMLLSDVKGWKANASIDPKEPIIIYYHLTLQMTDRLSPAGCPPITTLLALFFFIDI